MSDYIVRTADEVRVARAHAGAALCRDAIAGVTARRQAEQLLQRARERAEDERRAARDRGEAA
jgi:hypothetical protein